MPGITHRKKALRCTSVALAALLLASAASADSRKDDIYSKGLSAADKGDVIGAREAFCRLAGEAPDYKPAGVDISAQEQCSFANAELQRLIARSNANYVEGMELFQDGRYSEAALKLQNVKAGPFFGSAKSKLAEARNQKDSRFPAGKSVRRLPETDEHRTASYFDSIKRDPLLLRQFLRAMPKGGDLHNHLSGAIYAESYIQWAADAGMCVDTQSLTLVAAQKPVGKAAAGCAANQRPAADALKDMLLYRALIDALSMRNFSPASDTGEYHFFDTFSRFGAVSSLKRSEMLAEVMHRAGADHVLYLELMLTTDGNWWSDVAARLGPISEDRAATPTPEQVEAYRQKVIAAGIDEAARRSKANLDSWEQGARRILQCDAPASYASATAPADPSTSSAASSPAHENVPRDPGCDVTVRYLYEVYRNNPLEKVLAQSITAMELTQREPRIVGINFVQPEDYYTSIHDFDRQMHLLDVLHAGYPHAHIALHAGELAAGQVPPEVLGRHIPRSIDTGHAERIGHGVDVMHYADVPALLAEMKQKNIPVEICLTSNALILGVRGAQHPLHAYLAAGVPVVISSDDEGVSRSDLTSEYARAVEEQEMSYAQLKAASRDSLRFAFDDLAREKLLQRWQSDWDAFEKEKR